MYLTSKESASYLMKNQFNTNGAYLTASNKTLGYKLYKIKLFEDISLENDPHFRCRNYEMHGDYNRVFSFSHLSTVCFTHNNILNSV